MTEAEVEAGYAFCRQFTRASHSSFRWSFLLLPPAKRRAMDALYAFMRYTDDLGDAEQPANQRAAALDGWRAAVHAALVADAPAIALAPPGGRILPALADTVRRFGVPARHLDDAIDGQQMDLHISRYATFAELERYCEKVGSSVGMACLHIWEFGGDHALELARQAGIAFQLTNILRDVREDYVRGRIYLPADDMEHCGYSEADLAAGRTDDRFAALMNGQIARAREYYERCRPLAAMIAADSRRVFGLMRETYAALLEKIARQPVAVLAGRVRLTFPARLRLVARWWLGRESK